tara:strand:+ start:53 stop:337 length:285 start_codon:yes stop_codon:yes gene_type:complete
MIETYLICGYIGSTLFTVNLMPQLYKMYKTKKVQDISYGWQLSYFGATTFSMIFAFHTPYPHLKIGLTVEMLNILAMMYLKRMYSPTREVLPKE